ncbi:MULTISPECIES: N-acyl-L-amino acid amidohydrolase [Brenneria]|uniref:Amidohydrolase n=1 Tax=Brenneria nigrifluens DSM 30175 = ATCC 13028 TaxID=1121120 RepID=A0A2U1UPM5_9GAMM|nr:MULTISPECIES: N-acyl-L-amino acid amidohydrolase [Brenneria]EHD20724.1 N-acyl-L-amino acid amidohydrolase [Brenneria sp. EniD312]PWC23639.1 hypothetical protein DDT54_13185 [Brenneria nigrifluens DSM 30175 = ATCC 13028]QCR03898.1 hypothetical protein EH206_06735 [Brenneria nigrifluens DSM 30175 = ATCC 13028]
MSTVDAARHRAQIQSHIERSAQRYLRVSHQIHARPEIGNQEFFAAETLVDVLREAGFAITQNIAGHETGFIARKGERHSGPRIGYLAEYDALALSGYRLLTEPSLLAAVKADFQRTH